MKSKVVCGSRANTPVMKTERQISQDALLNMLSSPEWDAQGTSVSGDIVLNTPIKISNLCVNGSITVNASAVDTVVENCIVNGRILVHANSFALLRSTVRYSGEGLVDSSENRLFVRDCTFEGEGIAISSRADNVEIRSCTLSGDIVLGEGENCLVALTRGTGIHLSGMRNTAVVKNRAEIISADGCHALYVIENSVKNTLSLCDNNHLIADINDFGAVTSEGNENVNGDTLVDINARLPYGADENLLPHVDKDLFVGMERKKTVRDPELDEELTLPNYVMQSAHEDNIVIIAPGAYCSDERMSFDKESSDTVIYAYGVYAERQEGVRSHMHFIKAENITVKGMFVAYKQQSCGQVYIVALEGINESGNRGLVRVIAGAGLVDDFATSNPDLFSHFGSPHRDFFAYCDMFFGNVYPTEPDGTRIVEVSLAPYQKLRVGDVLHCRERNGGTTVYISECANIMFYDFTMYGNAGGFAWTESNNLTATHYFRVLNTSRTGEIIDEETYNRYRAYEEKYGISFDLSVDELGRFRGSPCRIGSVDATHTMRCGQGSVVHSCLFENMCDDGTNQNHTHARLSSITDNKDGTSTLVYKGMQPMHFYRARGGENFKEHLCDGYCAPFKKGHRVYVYNSGGQLVCDTPALTDSVFEKTEIAPEYGTEYKTYSLKIATDAVNFGALEGYDLSKNTPDDNPGDKVMVDNMSLASNGFIFDNTLVRNIRSRGLLIKASEGVIENCTFENIGMSCAAILYEITWGESGVTENMTVRNNLFDHTGYFNPGLQLHAPISIKGLGSSTDEDYLLYKNILIEGNVIKNRTTDYAVYVNSAKGVTIRNNDFGSSCKDKEFKTDILIDGAVNIDISDNVYSREGADKKELIKVGQYKNIFGSDVTENGEKVFKE